jgi:hypothetical protein
MWSRILTVGLCFVFVVGCAKKTAKKPSSDDTPNVKLAPPANDKDKKNEKAEEPNWLNDSRFKKDSPSNLPPDGSSPGKQPWGISPPQGGWQGPNASVPTVQPAAPGGMPMPAMPVPGIPAPPGMGVLQPQPVPAKPPATPTTPKFSPVAEADMKEVWIFIENASGASGKMPTQLLTYQALIAAKSPAADLVKSGSIYLTGATSRESIWAFETQAITQGGLVATQNGVETLTAAELKTRLGK